MNLQHREPDLALPDEAGDTVMLASDDDRDAVVGVLNEAFAEGRLTADEHGERVSAVYVARTWPELARLTADLPGPAGAAGPALTGVPGELDRCLLCALLICCPPAGIAWLLVWRHRSRAARHPVLTPAGRPSRGPAGTAMRAGDVRHAQDR